MKVAIFYHALTEERRAILNGPKSKGGGWGGDVGRAYASAKCDGISPSNADYFELAGIAEFTIQDNDAAWTRFQNLAESWSDVEGIDVYTDFPRSSMVGDYIIWDDGSAYRVEPAGFRKATEAEKNLLTRNGFNALLRGPVQKKD